MWASIRHRSEQADPKTDQLTVTYEKAPAYSAVSAAIDNGRKAIGWVKPDPLFHFGDRAGAGERIKRGSRSIVKLTLLAARKGAPVITRATESRELSPRLMRAGIKGEAR
jgi:hypothetical protein